MSRRWSRRGFLLALGGGATVAVLVWRSGGPAADESSGEPGYLDHEGWILTVDDKRKLAPGPGGPPEIREN